MFSYIPFDKDVLPLHAALERGKPAGIKDDEMERMERALDRVDSKAVARQDLLSAMKKGPPILREIEDAIVACRHAEVPLQDERLRKGIKA